MWKVLARLVAPRRRARPAPAADELPVWAQVGRARQAHIRRVAALLEEWADAMGASERIAPPGTASPIAACSLRAGRPIHPLTLEFWNVLASR